VFRRIGSIVSVKTHKFFLYPCEEKIWSHRRNWGFSSLLIFRLRVRCNVLFFVFMSLLVFEGIFDLEVKGFV
jgi:hypothetical protein